MAQQKAGVLVLLINNGCLLDIETDLRNELLGELSTIMAQEHFHS
jgi:hypothetical protein